MAILNSIIHCLLDREPSGFHQPDIEDGTITFAVNLAFEVRSDGLGDPATDESDAAALFLKFLSVAQSVSFQAFRVHGLDGGQPTLDGVVALETVSEPDGSAPAALHDWLKTHHGLKAGPHDRFWTTLGDPPETVEAETTDAYLTLRGSQAWNAPVAHRFGLTHLIRVPATDLQAPLAIFPYFDAPEPQLPQFVASPYDPQAPIEDQPDALFDFGYEPGHIGDAVCRLTIVVPDLIADPLPRSTLDPRTNAAGYLDLNPDAENVHRFLTTFEERAGAFLAAGNALALEGNDDASTLETLFGFHIGDDPPSGQEADREMRWGATMWFVFARLICALDMSVLALMKPQDQQSEGDVLAPFVSCILSENDELGTPFDGLDAYRILAALRQVLAAHCPLVAGGSKVLGPVLARIFDIAPIARNNDGKPVIVDPIDLITLMLESVTALIEGTLADDRVPEAARRAVLSLEGRSVATLSQCLADLEQKLQNEAGAEKGLLSLFESTELRGDGGAVGPNERFAFRIAQACFGIPPEAELVALIDRSWERYRLLLDGPFNGAEAIRRTGSATFAKRLIDAANTGADPITAQDLADRVTASDYYTARLISPTGGAFDGMLAPLLLIDGTYRPILGTRIKEAFDRAVAPLAALTQPGGRFVPDTFPQPLPIQIASGIDGGDLDDLLASFNGICVGIRRRDDENTPWAYANLADLGWPADTVSDGTAGALHP
ncbi:hypothetical protein, partial [Novosphingobium sp. AP12]|uniref:hypothetical protein n=1 Tax=Novosphingobium sp. AP12 TaxID=1144305 RepID=UPI00027205D0